MTNRIVFAMIDNIRFLMRHLINSRNENKRFDKHSYVATEIDNLAQKVRAMENTHPARPSGRKEKS